MTRPFKIGDRVQIVDAQPGDGGRRGVIYKDWGNGFAWHVELDPRPEDEADMITLFCTEDLKHVAPLIQLAECAD